MTTIKPPLAKLLKRSPLSGRIGPTIAHQPTGQLTSNRQIIQDRRAKPEVVVEEDTKCESLSMDSPAHTALAGINIGLTIPGPKNSYMAARIDVFGFVPALPSDEGMRAAYERVANLAQERLELEVDEAKEALGLA
jgi:hypothetical protein